MKKILLRFFVCAALIVAVFIAWLHYDLFVMPTITAHRGDGKFANVSRRVWPFALPGYTITITTFDLGKPFDTEYKIANLTNIRRECHIHLVVLDQHLPLVFDPNTLNGRLKIGVLDSTGGLVMSVEGRLGEYTWSQNRGRYVLYQMWKDGFEPNPRERYVITVKYEPDQALTGLTGFFYIRSGDWT